MVIKLRPCAHCERELPPGLFDSDEVMFCKRCTKEAIQLMSKKYTAIESAVIRAKLRRRSRTARMPARAG